MNNVLTIRDLIGWARTVRTIVKKHQTNFWYIPCYISLTSKDGVSREYTIEEIANFDFASEHEAMAIDASAELQEPVSILVWQDDFLSNTEEDDEICLQ